MQRLTLGLLFLVLLAGGCRIEGFAPLPPKESRTLQSLLEWTHENGMPGAILLVRTPRSTFVGAVGYADVARQTPMRPDYAFRIASVTKTFTGVVIAQLEAEGRIDTTRP